MTRIIGVQGFEDAIVFGSYWGNPNHETVSIYSVKYGVDDCNWEVKFSFPKNTVRHIHNIIPDKRKSCVYILTGDADEESGVWIAKDNFSDVKPLLIGKQKYRTCHIFPFGDGFLLPTDSPTEINTLTEYLCSDDEIYSSNQTCLAGSCIYAVITQNGYLFSTTVEPDPSYVDDLFGVRFYLTYKLGKGILDSTVHVYQGTCVDDCTDIMQFRKDIIPMALGQYGTVNFVYDEIRDIIWLHPVAVKKYDGVLCMYKKIQD